MYKVSVLQLIYYRTLAELKIEASKAKLGVMWWLLDPAMYLLLFYVIFGIVFKRGEEGFVTFLLCGLVFWRWFDTSVRMCSNSILKERLLLDQVYLPKTVLPATILAVNTVKFALVLVLFIIYLLLVGDAVTVFWLYLPVILVVQLFLSVGAGLLVAAVIPFAPDLLILINYGMTFFFFLAGIFFRISEVSPHLKAILYLNPMAPLIESYRMILLEHSHPLWIQLIYVLLISLIMTGIGLYMLKRYDREYPRLVE